MSDPEHNTQYTDFLQRRSGELDRTAQNALSLLKIDLVILGLFLPIVSTLLGGGLNPEAVFNSPFTQIGLIIWLLSAVSLVTIYHYSRLSSVDSLSPQQAKYGGEISNEEYERFLRKSVGKYSNWPSLLNNAITAATVSSLIATGLFSLGVLSPYVSPSPSMLALVVAGIVLLLVISYYLLRRLILYGPKLKDIIPLLGRKGWNELTEARQEVVKEIYDRVGYQEFDLETFLYWSFALRSGTVVGSDTERFSKHLLDRLVEDGYYEVVSEEGEKIRTPSGGRISPENAEKPVVDAVDRLAKKLERDQTAQQLVAKELNTDSEEVLSDLYKGANLDKLNRYNRVVEAIYKSDGVDTDLIKFEYIEKNIRYRPTRLAEIAYKQIEHERQLEKLREEHRKEVAEREESMRREANTYNFIVIEAADEQGNVQVVSHDPKIVGEDFYFSMNAEEVGETEEEIQRILDLEVDDQLRLRIETDNRTLQDYIAEAFC